jgi:hypothetical protein
MEVGMSNTILSPAQQGISIDITDQYRAAEMLADIRLLLRLDNLWTESFERSEKIRERDVTELMSVVERIASLLNSLPGRIDWAQKMIKGTTNLDVALEKAIAGVLISQRHRDALLKKISDRGGAAAYALEAMDEVKRLVPEEIQNVREKLTLVASERPTDGDLSQSGRCARIGAATVLSAATGQWELTGWFAAMGASECLS